MEDEILSLNQERNDITGGKYGRLAEKRDPTKTGQISLREFKQTRALREKRTS